MADLTSSAALPTQTSQPQRIVTAAFPQSAAVIQRNLAVLHQNKTVTYPHLEVPKYHMRFAVSKWSRQNLQQVGATTNIGNLILPLSNQLVSGLEVGYNVQALGFIADKMVEGLNQLAAQRRAAGDNEPDLSPQTVTGDALVGVLSQAQIEALQAFRDQKSLGVPFVGPAIQQFLGVAPNHFLTVVFEGPKYKSFIYEWLFIPESPQDSEALRKVIRAFEKYSSPGVRADGAIWEFPHIWSIAIQPNPKYMYRHKPCVVKRVQYNLAPTGHFTPNREDPHTNSALLPGLQGEPLSTPKAIHLQVEFMEIEYWITENFGGFESDFADDNDPFSATPSRPVPERALEIEF